MITLSATLNVYFNVERHGANAFGQFFQSGEIIPIIMSNVIFLFLRISFCNV